MNLIVQKIQRYLSRLSLAAAISSLCACTSIDSAIYANEQPKFDLQQYFNGTVDAWGVFTDRSGKVVKRFTVVLNCKWQNNTGVLHEDFTYSDGSKQTRIWTIEKNGDQYTGTADDVVGQAKGIASGNALFWSYTLALPVDGKIYHVQFKDWMYLMDQKVMLNKAEMSKFGFKLGEVTLSFQKR